MSLRERIVGASLGRPRTVMVGVALLTLGLGSQIPRIQIDTDPENMLPADQGARLLHDRVKRDFSLYDMLVVGVVDEESAEGVFTPSTLAHVHELTERILGLEGVVRQEVMSLATVDNIEQGGPGEVRFDWLMGGPPATPEEARAIRDAATRIPAVYGTLVSEDGRATAIYVPVESKDQSRRIAAEIDAIVGELGGSAEYHITGLPVAEDTFGAEMFKQMGVAAPVAGLLVLLLMYFFFRSWSLVIAPMIVAMVTVVATMGLLIGAGFTVHIMSSMIPIFLMPIAVVDSVHILSEFADTYPRIGDRRETVRVVMGELFKPMLYTSLTSAAGFASLAFTPIPPVQVFGAFVAIGIGLAFLLTITFIPAYVVTIDESRIAKLRHAHGPHHDSNPLARLLTWTGPWTLRRAKAVTAAAAVLGVASLVGISTIRINDNPVRWFRSDHEIRVADRVLNEHFAGTYNAFLVLESEGAGPGLEEVASDVGGYLAEAAAGGEPDVTEAWNELVTAAGALDVSGEGAAATGERIAYLVDEALSRYDTAPTDAEAYLWDDVVVRLEEAQSAAKLFQTPEALAYVESLQSALDASGLVGKSIGLTDIVKTVHRELREGDPAYFSIPASSGAVAQTLLSYQSSHRPDDLWHFVTPDFTAANLWLQLKSGDNQDMVRVTEAVDAFVAQNAPPAGVRVEWAGLTYLNVVWQQDMVSGMLKALIGGFVIVFLMMLVLFRSLGFAVLAMLPPTITIGFIYGMIGFVGKDYDMPVAVLSSLTLGLSVDFAIHFLQRARVIHGVTGDWALTVERMFAEPARAIGRNAILIAIGFLPLLLSPLVPYNTVGLFLAAIMSASAVVTLVLLPSVIQLVKRWLLAETGREVIEAKEVTA